MDFAKVSTLQKTDMLVSFLDLQGFGSIAHVIKDPVELFTFMNGWASTIIKEVEGTSGGVLKFIGDECLVIFPEDSVDSGIGSLLSIKKKTEAYFKEKGFSCKLRVTAHFGEVAIGLLGEGSFQCVDIIGEVVNTAATLGRGEQGGQFVISPQTFRKLSASVRKNFQKHTPPIVYVAKDNLS